MNNNNVENILALIEKIRQGEQKEFDILFRTYKPLITAKVNEFSQSLEADEVEQISAIALYDAAMSYNPDKVDNKVTFGLYADICIRNRLISELRRNRTNEVLRCEIMPLEEGALNSPEEDFLRKEETMLLLKRARELLTPYENSVFCHYLNGKSYDEIAQTLGKNKKSVDNALRRIRDKIREHDNTPE
ncbi:MAG: sigma-70 family RNA polymerase sigma factor [Clostridia bacterium]|nr:sigma-70 family RNA polymerase sigma factor [Clostridia bacterium]